MKVTTFDPGGDLIIVSGRVWGLATDPIELRLVLDTGAGETIIVPEVIDDLGYSAREHGEQIAVMRSAVGHEHGYMIRVARFACLGLQETSFRVHAQDLPEGWGIDGLVGLSFLRQLNYEIRSREGRILVERAPE
ncbi:MAG: aspartyl protease family protein [Acidobacteria bacterium]|nr:aspartyl protease family protein [Acidobacteriota bacterium]